MSMSHDELRLECLKLAQGCQPDHSTKDIVDRAHLYANFVLDHAARPTAMPAQPATPESEADPQAPEAVEKPAEILAEKYAPHHPPKKPRGRPRKHF